MRLLLWLAIPVLGLAQITTFPSSSGSGSGTGTSPCVPGSASGTTYTCAPSTAVTAYTSGLTLNFIPDVAGSGGATTVNVSSLGAKSIKRSDGSTNPSASDFVAGVAYTLIYDGTEFREAATGPT